MSFGKTMLRKLRALMMRFMPLMITCRECEGFIVDYLEGTLPKDQHRKFDLHLHLCRDCERYLEAYKRTITLSQSAFREPDEPMPEELVKAILAAGRKDT
ncbi:MAG: anti-sigma factor family protein [Acidiferrobacterales bacterium]